VDIQPKEIHLDYKSGDLYTLEDVLQKAKELWPGITPDQILISPNSYLEYTGGDVIQEFSIEPTESWLSQMGE
jgi:hypothetical protein